MHQSSPPPRSRIPIRAVNKNPKSTLSPRRPPRPRPRPPLAAAPVSSSSSSSSPSPQVSQRSIPSSPLTRQSTPIHIQQSSDSQPIQQIPDTSSNVAIHVRVSLPGQPGQWKTAEFPFVMPADKLVCAGHNLTEPIMVEEEKEQSAPDQSRIESETKIDKLKMEIEEKTFEIGTLRSEVAEQKNQLQERTSELEKQTSELEKLKSELLEANEKCTENGTSNLHLRDGITERVFKVMNFLEEHAFRKEVYEKWQNQEFSDDDYIVNEELTERQKDIDLIWMEDYVSMQGRVDQLEQELEDEKHKNQQTIEQLILERDARIQAQEQAQEQAREQATQVQAAQGQFAEVQAQNDTLITRAENLRNQLTETQQWSDALEAQRQGDEALILDILVTHQLRENFLIHQLNEALLQQAITREAGEQLVQALGNTINLHEEEIEFFINQIPEMHDASRSEADLHEVIKARNRHSRSRNMPELKWTRSQEGLRLEIDTGHRMVSADSS